MYLIQSSTNSLRLEQAFDAALVAAVFKQSPLFLIFLAKKAFFEHIEKSALNQKMEQLQELSVKFIFANEISNTERIHYLQQSAVMLTF